MLDPATQRPRTAVVTGAASGIGEAIVRRLTAVGWQVVGVDRDHQGLCALQAEITDLVPVAGDLGDPETVCRARDAAQEAGSLEAWVNNAALVRLGTLHTLEVADLDEIISINLRAVLLGAQQAVQSFLHHDTAGAVVNLSSVHARNAFPGHAVYDTCKGGVEALTRYICAEYGHLGIRCNAVAPGAVLTPATIHLSEQTPDPQAAIAATRELSPMHRISTPDEIADAVEFLLSPAAAAINGHVLAVDNGMAARSNTFPPDPNIRFRTSPQT